MNDKAASTRQPDATTDAVTPPQQAVLFRRSRYERVTPDLEQVYRLLGLQARRPNHQRWFETIDELKQALPRLMRPRAVFRIDSVRRLESRRLELESNAVFDGAVGRFLAHAELVATFVVTIGSAVERLSRIWLKNGRVMQATVADALASEAAEATAQRCQDEIRAWARPQSLDVTPRYSPGYCGMHVTRQATVFASLPAASISVRLTPSSLMVPVKSVSGLIGIGPADKVSFSASALVLASASAFSFSSFFVYDSIARRLSLISCLTSSSKTTSGYRA